MARSIGASPGSARWLSGLVHVGVGRRRPAAPPGPRLERLFAPLKEELASLPPFLRDTDVSAHFRIYYFNQLKPDDTRLEALAGGGWIKYQSGWLLDTFAMGASFFGSAPLYAPADTDGTLLLKTGQKGYLRPG